MCCTYKPKYVRVRIALWCGLPNQRHKCQSLTHNTCVGSAFDISLTLILLVGVIIIGLLAIFVEQLLFLCCQSACALYTGRFFFSLPWVPQLSRDFPVDAGFLCDTASFVGAVTIQGTPCSTVWTYPKVYKLQAVYIFQEPSLGCLAYFFGLIARRRMQTNSSGQ